MIHFFTKRRQYELAENSRKGAEKDRFSSIFWACSLAFANVKKKMRDLRKPFRACRRSALNRPAGREERARLRENFHEFS
jgi:hypothetical protein